MTLPAYQALDLGQGRRHDLLRAPVVLVEEHQKRREGVPGLLLHVTQVPIATQLDGLPEDVVQTHLEGGAAEVLREDLLDLRLQLPNFHGCDR